MKELKICKGIGKGKGYKGCGQMVKANTRRYGLCMSCYPDFILNTDYGKILLEKATIKGKQKAEKEQRKRTKEERESMKSIARLIQEAREPFQKWIRFRDANEPCISCGTTKAKIWHSGHYLKAELFTGVIFNPTNVNKQCERCNTFLNGNESEYRIGLVKKYGEMAVKELEEAANHLREYKFSRDEIKSIKTKYQKLLREIKS